MASTVRNWFSLSSIKKWLSNINPLKTKALPQHEDYLTKTLGKYEPYVFYLQQILIWDDPIISSFSILTVNVLFWLVFNFELRFYGVVFTTLLVWMCYEAWFDHIWPEISVPSEQKPVESVYSPQQPSGVLSVPEISSYVAQTGKLVKQYCLRLWKLRAEQPGMFCLELGSSFACLAAIGRAMPGPILSYTLVMTVMVAPGVWIHILPPHVKVRLAEVVVFLRENAQAGACDIEDMVPESSHENLHLFHLAGQAENDSDKDDSNEFAFDPDDTDGLMSLMSSPRVDEFALHETSSGSSAASAGSAGGDGIRFRGSHFDGSSDEDDDFARGMTFKATQPETQGAAQATAALLGNLGSLLASAMTRANSQSTQRRRSSSSDLDDFEIIDPSREKLS